MSIPFVDLSAQYKEIESDISQPLKELFNRGDFILGKPVKEFEEDFSRYCAVKYAVGVNSGTDALFLGLLSLGIKEGDEVIVPAFTYIATAFAVSMAKAKPVFVDVDEKTYTINPALIEKAIAKKAKAIIPVHLYGQAADMDAILKIAQKHNLKVIEDTAQAHGAVWTGSGGKPQKAGSIADIGCFSFYPTKNLGAFGDGGMVITNDEAAYKKLIMLRDYGRKDRYAHITMGYNSRLDSIQAIILRAKLRHLDAWNTARANNAAVYNDYFKGVEEVVTPQVAKYSTHVYHIYGVRLKARDAVSEKLRQRAVGVLIHYPIPLHLQEAYKELGYKKGDFPVSERVAAEILSLPMFPHMTKDQIKAVVDEVKAVIHG